MSFVTVAPVSSRNTVREDICRQNIGHCPLFFPVAPGRCVGGGGCYNDYSDINVIGNEEMKSRPYNDS